jgi:cell division protein FtsQ
MGVKKNIRRIIFICAWLLAGTGVTILLIAAVNSRNHQLCKGYDITINGKQEGRWFINKEDIVNAITSNKSVTIKNKPVKSFNLARIEAKLTKEPWVRSAQLFFDNNGMLNVKVKEREPVARIFTVSGHSFYIDSAGKKLPLSDKVSPRLPVFTGYPYAGKKPGPLERKMLKQVKSLGAYILNDPFWMAQIAQIDISATKEFEMVPTIGNHIIEFGNAENMEDKFRRLFVFYKQVLAKTGMEKYERIKVQYDKQVIGVKHESNNN